jgi:protein-tyrosine-phosphatase
VSDRGKLRIVTLCTGNAARSVMAGALLVRLAAEVRLDVRTAGTHVVEGQPMSRRTRDALAAAGARADGHRSHQVTDEDLVGADLVVALAGEHVAYVRRVHPGAADRTGTLKRLCRDLPPAPGPLAQRVGALRLDAVELEPWEDVPDPAGGEDADYLACVLELERLTAELARRLGLGAGPASAAAPA